MNFRGRGTLLNFATVFVGALIGIGLRGVISSAMLPTVKLALGVVTLGLALKLLMGSKQVLIVAFSLVLGGMIGQGVGLGDAIRRGALDLQSVVPAGDQFATGLVLTSVLFCVGPLTILGCFEDAIERKIELLSVKSLLDGFAAIIFATAYTWGVVGTAFVVLLFQGLLTALAWPLRRLGEDQDLLQELTATGGGILVLVGIQLLDLSAKPNQLNPENYLPGLVIAPLAVIASRRAGQWWASRKPKST